LKEVKLGTPKYAPALPIIPEAFRCENTQTRRTKARSVTASTISSQGA
jgi:hypothetical protein